MVAISSIPIPNKSRSPFRGGVALSSEVEQPVANGRALFYLRHSSIARSQGAVAVHRLPLGKRARIALECRTWFAHDPRIQNI
jgi:hypothetical protein